MYKRNYLSAFGAGAAFIPNRRPFYGYNNRAPRFYNRYAAAPRIPLKRTRRFYGGNPQIEKKFLDSSRASMPITSPTDASGAQMDPTTLLALNSLVQGTSQSTRVGNKIYVLNCYVKGSVRILKEVNQVAADQTCQIFVALVKDTQTNGAQLNSQDVFVNTSAAAFGCPSPMRNLLFHKRFKILKQDTFTLKPSTLSYDGTNLEQGGDSKDFEWFCKLNMPVEFKANAGTVADIVDNSLHLIAFASGQEGSPELTYNARIRFTDL